jgi:hypothetical protein
MKSTSPAPQTRMTAPTAVTASAGKAWDAVIDVFAEHNIPIRNMERVSGFITSDLLGTHATDVQYADCGSFMGKPWAPTDVIYNVVVRGDSSASTVRVTARWRGGTGPANAPRPDCTSNLSWESAFESRVKAIAEGRQQGIALPPAIQCTQSGPADSAELNGEDMGVDVLSPNAAGTCVTHHCGFRYGATRMTRDAAIRKCREETAALKP